VLLIFLCQGQAPPVQLSKNPVIFTIKDSLEMFEDVALYSNGVALFCLRVCVCVFCCVDVSSKVPTSSISAKTESWR
jgi:hypothetical protein